MHQANLVLFNASKIQSTNIYQLTTAIQISIAFFFFISTRVPLFCTYRLLYFRQNGMKSYESNNSFYLTLFNLFLITVVLRTLSSTAIFTLTDLILLTEWPPLRPRRHYRFFFVFSVFLSTSLVKEVTRILNHSIPFSGNFCNSLNASVFPRLGDLNFLKILINLFLLLYFIYCVNWH